MDYMRNVCWEGRIAHMERTAFCLKPLIISDKIPIQRNVLNFMIF